VPFDSVFVANNATDTAATINTKLDAGLHVVLAPGIYHLHEPLRLHTAGQVLLGIGMATLVSTAGNTAVDVADVPGVRVAGLLLDAGDEDTRHLIKWGEASPAEIAGSSSTPPPSPVPADLSGNFEQEPPPPP
jgi:hypothetical protein